MRQEPVGIELAIDCLAVSLRQMVTWQTGHRLVEEGGLLFAVGTKRFPTGYANSVLPLSSDIEAGEVLERVAGFYGRLGRPYILWVVSGLHYELEEAALEAAMPVVSEMPAMLLREALPGVPVPAGIEVEAVVDEEGLADYVDVAAEAYEETGLPPQVVRSYFGSKGAVLAAGNHLVVARVEDAPVAAALSVTDGTGSSQYGGVCWVGTKPGQRGRGAGEACTRAVTNAAFDNGARFVALEASPMGEPVYRRMGYVEVGRYRWYLGGALDKSDL